MRTDGIAGLYAVRNPDKLGGLTHTPDGENPEECIMECVVLTPRPAGSHVDRQHRCTILGPDDDWVDAPELGMLAKVFNQDVVNMPEVQRGLKAMKKGEVIVANYGETKPRHLHKLLKE